MKLPSLNAIRAFEAAARLRSFKDAADELRLTPSAVSRHIRSQEHSLGIELFERGFRQVTLTPKATHYARRLSAAFRSIENATEETAGHVVRPDRAKRASLSINATFMNLWLADRLPRFRAENPDFDLDVSIHDDENRGGNPSADLRVVFAVDAGDPSLVPLVSLVVFPVCSPTLLAGPGAPRDLADLAKQRLLHENTTAWWEEWFEKEGLKVDAKSGPIFHDPALAVREAVNGGGVALVDNIMAQDLLARGQLVAPFPVQHTIPVSYCLQQKPGNRGLAGIKRFRE